MAIQKIYKSEKYIYLLMGYKLATLNGGYVKVGNDTGMKGGEHYQREFTIQKDDNNIFLIESKNGSNFAKYSKTYIVGYGTTDTSDKPTIRDYVDENWDNYGANWIH